MFKILIQIGLLASIFVLPVSGYPDTVGRLKKNDGVGQTDPARETVEKTRRVISEVIEKAFPELNDAVIKVRIFESDSNFFKARFSITRVLTFQKKSYVIYVNPAVFERSAPTEGIQAIIAHELAHILYYKEKNCLQLLGLIGLADRSFTAKFERKADLTAIQRGFGAGLKSYRNWLYQNIPAGQLQSKKRDYFTPEEIDLILEKSAGRPELFDVWRRNVPRGAEEIR